jgi:hypothetical protein
MREISRHGVRGLPAPVEIDDRLVDALVGGTVEVQPPEHLDAVGDGVLGKHHPAQDGLLGDEILGRGTREVRRTSVR